MTNADPSSGERHRAPGERGRSVACPGCGFVGESEGPGPAHDYIGASAACWERFGLLRAAHIRLGAGAIAGAGIAGPGTGVGAGSSTGLADACVDAYMAQHPGMEERRSIQSVAVHLMALGALLERGWSPSMVMAVRRAGADRTGAYRWLAPPAPIGELTVADVLAADDKARGEAARRWIEGVWAAWARHHGTIRSWLDAVGQASTSRR